MIRCYENLEKGKYPSNDGFGFPALQGYTEQVPDNIKWVDFNDARDKKIRNKFNGLHFYIDDYKFNCLWQNPIKYIDMLQEFEYVIQPDFSLFYDFPVIVQMYNKYKNHWLYNFYGTYNINMIPNINISTIDNYDWSFCGFPKNSVVAVSDIGRSKDKVFKSNKVEIIRNICKTLEPSQILYFTRSKNTEQFKTLSGITPAFNPVILDFMKRGYK